MKELFNYIGYRVLRWNRVTRKAKNDSRAIAYITLIEMVFILDIIAIIITENFNSDEKFSMRDSLKIISLGIGFLIYIFNINYFRNKFSMLDSKWSNEDIKRRKLRGCAIVLSFIFIFLFWIFYLQIRGNVLG